MPATDEQHIDDPTQCGAHCYDAAGVSLGSLTSKDGMCDLGDSFVCAASGSSFFNYYFAGRFRQVHPGTAVWLSDSTLADAFIGVLYVDVAFARGWAYVFAYASTGNVYAFCPTGTGEEEPVGDAALSPWSCNENWYVVNYAEGSYGWINDPLMDVDECAHPDAPSNATVASVVYSEKLCLKDATSAYSPYQS